jgi:uncharacterized protein
LQWKLAIRLAESGKAVLLLDEAQYYPNWSQVVKAAIDQVYRQNLPLHVVVTGSAALELGSGLRETMAGRYERIALRQWNAQDLAEAFSISQENAVRNVVRFGSFPGAYGFISDLPRWKAYMRDSIIDAAIGRDILVLEAVKKPALLRQVFAVCAGHPSEILSLSKIAGAISETGALDTVAHYLDLLSEAYLVSALRKYSTREIRRRASSPKVVPLSNGFLAATSMGEPPMPDTDSINWGRWVENACLAFAVSEQQTVQYWREEPLEVDAVISGSWGKWAVEVKTGEYTSRDIVGVMEFCRRNPEYNPLVLCDEDHVNTAGKVGIKAIDWKEYLWAGVE